MYLVASSPKNLSFTWSFGGGSDDNCSAFAISFFKVLLERHANTSNEISGAFLLLPELEGLELIRFALPLATFLELIANRWNAQRGDSS